MKTKVKIITADWTKHLEDRINAFIGDKDVVDIKFMVSTNTFDPKYTAIIIYRED